MKFTDINWQTSNQQAYINCKILYDNNKHQFIETFGYNSPTIDYILFQIYKIFSYLNDKGATFTNLSISNNKITIFKDKSYNSPGNIIISIYRNFLQIECQLTKYTGYRNFIRLTITENEIYTTGFIKDDENPAITITGKKEKDQKGNLEIVTPSQKYYINNDDPWHILAILVDNVLGNNYFEKLKDNKDIFSKLNSTLIQKGLSEYQLEFTKLIHRYLYSSSDISYYQNDISLFFVIKSLINYLKEIKFDNQINIKQKNIVGLNLSSESIQHFINYEVKDNITGKPIKLIDIPLKFTDTYNQSYCEFLDYLHNLSEDDVDIFIIGLAYFATYCQDFGEISGKNLYGANIYPRYAGYKMNVAIQSSILNIPLVDFAKARYVQNGDNHPEVCLIFKNFGFNFSTTRQPNKITESPNGEIDISQFTNYFPYNLSHYKKLY